jgi:hypothetical protein
MIGGEKTPLPLLPAGEARELILALLLGHGGCWQTEQAIRIGVTRETGMVLERRAAIDALRDLGDEGLVTCATLKLQGRERSVWRRRRPR